MHVQATDGVERVGEVSGLCRGARLRVISIIGVIGVIMHGDGTEPRQARMQMLVRWTSR